VRVVPHMTMFNNPEVSSSTRQSLGCIIGARDTSLSVDTWNRTPATNMWNATTGTSRMIRTTKKTV